MNQPWVYIHYAENMAREWHGLKITMLFFSIWVHAEENQ